MDKTRSIGNMMNERPELQKIDSWISLLKQSEIFKISNVFLGRKQNYDNMAVAAEVQSKIAKDILSLSHTEKENIKEYLFAKIAQIDSNILSKLSKFSSKNEFPSFVYFIFGSIIGFYLIGVLNLPIATIIITFGLAFLCLMFLLFANNQKRYCHDYLISLLNS